MMKTNEILAVFAKEMEAFTTSTNGVKEFVLAVLEKIPDYFWESKEGRDNPLLAHTKASLAFANTLLQIPCYQEKFAMVGRDIIRAALFLHDAMAYGDGSERKIIPDHPVMMGTYIRHNYWEKYLPAFIREDIANAVETHSGKKIGNHLNDTREPETDVQWFVHTCVYLASKMETTVELSGVYQNAKNKCNLDFENALSIVRQMTDFRQWDGNVYLEGDGEYVYLDGNRCPVAPALKEAYITVGQSRLGQNRMILPWNDFIKRYPDWNNMFYGEPGNLYIISSEKKFYVSDEQARYLGAVIPM